jgi:hypothetical protein
MRGLDPRIHAIAGAASVRDEGVDGRIKSGHDGFELLEGCRVPKRDDMGEKRTSP